MRDSVSFHAFLTPGGRLTITREALEDLAADALLPAPLEPGDLHRPVFHHIPVSITVERSES